MKAVFTDVGGQEWDLAGLKLSQLTHIREITGIDFGKILATPGNLIEIFNDPIQLASIIWIICEKQAKERSITVEQFGDLFDHTTVKPMCDALLASVLNFFPMSQTAQALRNGFQEVMNNADQAAAKVLASQMSKATVTNLVERLESIPAHSPFDN